MRHVLDAIYNQTSVCSHRISSCSQTSTENRPQTSKSGVQIQNRYERKILNKAKGKNDNKPGTPAVISPNRLNPLWPDRCFSSVYDLNESEKESFCYHCWSETRARGELCM
jgi:hypothetical protein